MDKKTPPKNSHPSRFSLQYELNKITPEREDFYIKFAVGCGIFQILLAFGVVVYSAQWIYMLDVIFLLILTIGLYKRSLVASILMLTYFFLNYFYKLFTDRFGDGGLDALWLVLVLWFIFFGTVYYKALMATLKHRRRLKAEGKLKRIDKRSFLYGILTGAILTFVIFLIVGIFMVLKEEGI